jgi:U4/U6 small nuclear ribonucleoprotein PRP31
MEATATLADSLLDDLDDLSDGDENQEEDNVKESATFETDQDFIPMQEEDGPTASSSATTGTSSQTLFRKRKRWLDNVQLQQHLTIISNNAQVSGEEGYTLMTTSNTYLRQVQTELTHVHLELQSAYQVKFPELAELLPQFTLYKNAIVVLQNKDLSDVTLYQEELHSVANLSSNQIITLSVAGSTTSGTTLTESQLAQVNACLSYTDQLLNVQTQLTSFVEQHISSLAPNTCILLGPTLTARLVGLAGGLSALVQIPACNLQVLGQVKATSASRAGMGTGGVTTSTVDGGNSAQPHQGILVECDLVQRVRGKDQRKALKKLANKASLVVRCDLDSNLRRGTGNGGGNEIGKKFRRELEETFRKWQEPDKAPVVKALPK